MSLELHKEMMKKPPSSPMNNYVFRVNFFNTNYSFDEQSGDISPDISITNDLGFKLNNDSDRSMIAIKADLPSFETMIVTKKFLGSEKSYPILRKYGGDTTLEFYAHTNPYENNFVVYNFFKSFNKSGTRNSVYYHKEFLCIFNTVEILVGDRPGGKPIYNYHLNNCIVTKIDSGNLSYEGAEAIKYTMTIHYDDWTLETYNGEEESK